MPHLKMRKVDIYSTEEKEEEEDERGIRFLLKFVFFSFSWKDKKYLAVSAVNIPLLLGIYSIKKVSS